MDFIESLYQKIDEGIEGKNQGYSTGLNKLDSIIDGVTKQTYYVIFSNSGAGKTSLCLYSFIYRPLVDHIDDDNFRIVYFSLEMAPEMLFAKLLSTYIFEHYGIELSVKKLLSRQKGYTLPKKYREIVEECKPWLNKIKKKILIYDKAINAKLVYAIISKDLENYGKFETTEKHKRFIPNSEDLLYEVIIDHISLVHPSPGKSLKQEIDEVSKYLLTLRNIAGISPVVIQQANREQGNIERRKAGVSNFNINDTKDSGGPVQDAEIVISIYNPNRDRLNSYRGYDISQLADKFRIISVLKSRYGDSDVEIGINYFGWVNYWKEIPKPDDIYDYTKYQNPQYILKEIQNTENNIDTQDIKKELDNTTQQDNIKPKFKMVL